jgi:hypothetical protein
MGRWVVSPVFWHPRTHSPLRMTQEDVQYLKTTRPHSRLKPDVPISQLKANLQRCQNIVLTKPQDFITLFLICPTDLGSHCRTLLDVPLYSSPATFVEAAHDLASYCAYPVSKHHSS